ncbi:MAG: hypothetical protein HQ582_16080 [Planctomycetes bacterium]|nr:hypothetical protein [Planctomycetota bacterium]
MRSPLAQPVIAFLLTAAFLWCFRETVVKGSHQRWRAEILAEEKYQEFEHYVDENDLDYEKIGRICYAIDASDETFLGKYLVMAAMCGLIIVPYSILLGLIRRLAYRVPDTDAESGRDQTPEELRQ